MGADLVAEAPFGGIAPDDNYWTDRLHGVSRPAVLGRGWLARLPSAPRCKLCRAPAAGWGGAIATLLGHHVERDVLICHRCLDVIDSRPGGAIVEASVIEGELRDDGYRATSEAEIAFLRLAAMAIDRAGGVLDQFRNGTIKAFFLALVGGENHAERATQAMADLFRAGHESGLAALGVVLSAGLATGLGRAGTSSRDGRQDFTLTGTPVDVASRLATAAADGEALVTTDSWRRHGGPVAKSRLRSVPIPGLLLPIEAVVVRGQIEATI